MAYALILFPLALAAVAFVVPSNRWRPWLLPAGALGQLGLTAAAIFQPADAGAVTGLGGWLLLDPLGKVVLGFLTYASVKAGLESTLLFDQLIAEAPELSPPWLHAAFVLLFVGYGTKMGLAPMHTWKPDAYGEAPGIVGTLLAAGVTSCAFLAILRIYQICSVGSEAAVARHILVFMGLLS